MKKYEKSKHSNQTFKLNAMTSRHYKNKQLINDESVTFDFVVIQSCQCNLAGRYVICPIIIGDSKLFAQFISY